MKLTKRRADAIRKVINKHRLIIDRTKELDKRGYNLQLCSFLMERSPMGKIHEYKRSCRLQVGTTYGYMKYAWCVIFEPAPSEKISGLNKLYFSEESV